MFYKWSVLCAFTVCMGINICVPLYLSDVPVTHPKLFDGLNALSTAYLVFFPGRLSFNAIMWPPFEDTDIF